VADLAEKLIPALEPALDPDEQLLGACVSTQVGLFKGRMVVIGVTRERLIMQGMTRKFEPDGPPILLTPGRIADASAEGAGGGWADIGSAIMDRAAVTLKLRTVDGEKLKLMMMRGTGPLGGLGGGEDQRRGVQVIGEWFARHAPGERARRCDNCSPSSA
jgi:hypothetical protein